MSTLSSDTWGTEEPPFACHTPVRPSTTAQLLLVCLQKRLVAEEQKHRYISIQLAPSSLPHTLLCPAPHFIGCVWLLARDYGWEGAGLLTGEVGISSRGRGR